jgi:hypothetical protein
LHCDDIFYSWISMSMRQLARIVTHHGSFRTELFMSILNMFHIEETVICICM